ncbi:MAG: Asp23/Gls24 family envelope stress response protein [Clostridia bacterium]|nr:Asp23/Gls24 family envelope stress response protein [Clostridia bacterium]
MSDKSKVEEEVLQAGANDEKVEIATNLNISEDVIGIIAGLAASEVEGIAGMTLGFVDGINQILGSSKKYSRGVKIELDGKKVTVDIFVNVKYGVRIPDVAWAAQTAVKNAVETMTGLEVAAVNINVQGIIFDKPEDKKEDKKEVEATPETQE